jgi:hypothetical protein
MSKPISAADAYERHRIAFLQTEISYVDTGAGEPVVFLRQPPLPTSGATSSARRRLGRCLAPDLVGWRLRCSPTAPTASWTTHGTSTPGSKRLD